MQEPAILAKIEGGPPLIKNSHLKSNLDGPTCSPTPPLKCEKYLIPPIKVIVKL